ncbi:MAG: hypothetical protein NC124_20305 [Clostridium sp.]|nr:hypothetical protein [Ruminococcus flavefaciens]MCM1500807.1 hypothetical protein [Clostridium sp.]
MEDYMDKLKQDGPNAMMTPQQYFDSMKEKKNTVTSGDLLKIYDNCLELANKYRITGQIRGLRKILFCMESIEKEQKLVDMGITTFIYKDDIDFYIDSVANSRNRNEKPIKIIELERYEREIPDEIVEVIDKTKELFDQMYIVYTDYTGKEERKIEAERKQKDPILFGTFQNREKKVCIDRFYYLGDWVDEFCDLTLDKMVNKTEKLGRNIVRTIKTPKDIAELREYIDAHYEVEKDSISKIVRKADVDLKDKKNFFSKVRTVFTKRK